jgi:hypothetical protein
VKILENELLIKYDADRRMVEIFRLVDSSENKTIITSYPLDEFKAKGLHDMGRIIGEDILLLLTGTREEFMK